MLIKPELINIYKFLILINYTIYKKSNRSSWIVCAKSFNSWQLKLFNENITACSTVKTNALDIMSLPCKSTPVTSVLYLLPATNSKVWWA